MAGNAIVFVVDDDEAVRNSLGQILRSINLRIECFPSAEEFLSRDLSDVDHSGCVILDVLVPGGFKVLEDLQESKLDLPVIVLTAATEPTIAVKAMKLGAFDFIAKPLHPQLIIERVEQAILERGRKRPSRTGALRIQGRLDHLSGRERDVYDRLLQGKRTKEIAAELGIGVATVTKHRQTVFRKMGVENAVGLVRLATGLEVAPKHKKQA